MNINEVIYLNNLLEDESYFTEFDNQKIAVPEQEMYCAKNELFEKLSKECQEIIRILFECPEEILSIFSSLRVYNLINFMRKKKKFKKSKCDKIIKEIRKFLTY